MLALLATKIQSSRLDDMNSYHGFDGVADWLESRVPCMLGGLSLVDPARYPGCCCCYHLNVNVVISSNGGSARCRFERYRHN
jgi:hypothetical protein